MSAAPPIAGGNGGFSPLALQLITATQNQVEQVAQFNSQPRDFSVPFMKLASSLPAAPLSEMQTRFDVTA